jgi:hypothetical protein
VIRAGEAMHFNLEKFRVTLTELRDVRGELVAVAFVNQFYFKRPKPEPLSPKFKLGHPLSLRLCANFCRMLVLGT